MRKGVLSVALWSMVILTNAYFIYNFPFRHFNPESWNKPLGPLLTAHIVFGMVALLIGPLQFFASIRKKNPRLHRRTGRMYLGAIAAGAICAIILSIQHNIIMQKRIAFGTGTLGLAAAWLLTSAMALWAIKNRNFVQHREWMVRSYVVTCGFTFYRILFLITTSYISQGDKVYGNELSGILAWSCWAIPLLITEALLQGIKIKKQAVVNKPAATAVLAKEELIILNQTETVHQKST
ncbi:DUF2306 domain-containing protein [Flavisolibacter sp. BT320]|nr:DUF2306 domain-containing protein [Flavisolibacter longurius]